MPGVFFHFLVGELLIDRWPAPEIVTDDFRSSFLAGAIGPDLGYFAGQTLFSDFAHYIRSAELPKEMLAQAENDNDRAYAYGWFTHILSDVLVHPMINRAAARYAKSSTPLTYGDNSVLHIRIEQGLDAYQTTPTSALNTKVYRYTPVALVESAFRKVYDAPHLELNVPESIGIASKRLTVAFRLTQINLRRLGRAEQALARWYELWAFNTIHMLTSMRPASTFFALTHALSPDNALRQEAVSALAKIESEFWLALETNFQHLADFNLDLGELEQSRAAIEYPLARQALRKLDSIRKGSVLV